MAKEYTPDSQANALSNPDWRTATDRRRHMRKRTTEPTPERGIFDTQAEFGTATEFQMDWDLLLSHSDPEVRSTAKRQMDRWWNTLNQHRECNLYREELTFHEVERLNIATTCMALLRAVYKTAQNKRKYRFMGHSLSQMLRPLGYIVMGMIAKDHQGAHPAHIYTAILHDMRQLSDLEERRKFYQYFHNHNNKFFDKSGLMTTSKSYRKTTKRALSAGKTFGINHRLVLRPEARGLIEEFVDRFKQEAECLTKEAVLAKNAYIHNLGKIGKQKVVNPLDDLI